MTINTIKTIAIAAGLAAAGAGAVDAQDWTRPAAFGGVELGAGFSPDPHAVDLVAGGSISASSRFSNCTGYIADAPDYSLTYQAGGFPLIFTADSDSDTTLIINGPNGDWWCDDDGAEAVFNPMIRFDRPQSGRYDVWVGTFTSNSNDQATLFISEIGEHTRQSAGGGRITANQGGRLTANTGSMGASSGGGSGVDIFAAPSAGVVTLSGGFLPDPVQRAVTAGGPLSASSAVSASCRGYITREPTLELRYDGASTLSIYTSGGTDTTLAINTPDGRWVCDDDGGSGTNAGLSFGGDASGTYDIYVGRYVSGRSATMLNVSELGLGD